MNVVDAAVDWFTGFANAPELKVLVDEEPRFGDLVWHVIETDEGRYFVSVEEAPCVRFMFESNRGGGALGGVKKLAGGGAVRTNGGWSSSAPRINQLRQTDERFASLLPEDLVDASVVFPSWANVGLWGPAWYLSHAVEVVESHLPGVKLYLRLSPTDDAANAVQVAVIGGRAEGALWVPWPEGREGSKPSPDEPLYEATASEAKRALARAAGP